MANIIDLHNHTIASLDGEKTAKQLIDIAIKNNIKFLSITDHDCITNVKEAIEYSKDKDITIIPGIELSVDVDGTPVHILGYNIDYNNKKFIERQNYIKEDNITWGKKFIKKVLDFGFMFNPEDVYSIREDHLICEELVSETILKDSRNDNDERLKEFRPGGKYSDNPTFNFYRVFATPTDPLFVPRQTDMPIEEASKLIHESGGKMFLAHPHHNIKYSEELLNKIISFGLDGIEVFSSYHNKEATKYYYNKAKQHNLYMSVGSDFHGKAKPAIKIGSMDYDQKELEKTLIFLGVK